MSNGFSLRFGALAAEPQAVGWVEGIIVPDRGRLPWRRLLGSLFGALLVAAAGSIALLGDVAEPGPIYIAIQIIAMPVVRIVYLIGGMRGDQPIWFAVLASILVWWAIFFALLTRRARKRNAHRPT